MKNPHAVALGKKGGEIGGNRNTPAQKAARLANIAKANAKKKLKVTTRAIGKGKFGIWKIV